MAQHDIKINFEIKVANNGKISESMMEKVMKHLITLNNDGTYFITDSNGLETCWDIETSKNKVTVTCEVTSDELDHYNGYCVPRYNGKLDVEFAEYESYKVE